MPGLLGSSGKNDVGDGGFAQLSSGEGISNSISDLLRSIQDCMKVESIGDGPQIDASGGAPDLSEDARQKLVFVSDPTGRNMAADVARNASRKRLKAVIEDGQYEMVFQPVAATYLSCTVGYEALLRVKALPKRSPDQWLDEAEAFGLRTDFELGAIESALRHLGKIPPGVYLAVNVSPATVLSGQLGSVFTGYSLDRIVLEITEHDAIDDYDRLQSALADLRRGGLRLAIDDVCSGYASFRHIIRLRPDLIKMDRSITSGVDRHEWQQALTELLVRFAERTGCVLIAEGVETAAERDELSRLGVRFLQGYLLGVPGPLLTEGKG